MSFPSLPNRPISCKVAIVSLALVCIYGAGLSASGAPASAVSSASPLADKERQIFSSKEGFLSSWKPVGWGLQTKMAEDFGREGGNRSVEIAVGSEKPTDYPSFVIGGSVKDAIPLDDDLRSRGLIEFYLNGAKSPNEAAGQKLQFALTFIDSDGKSIRTPYLPLAQVSDSPELDIDPATWQLVTIRITDLLAKMPDPDTIKSLQSVIVQFLGVQTTVYFTDCSITLEK